MNREFAAKVTLLQRMKQHFSTCFPNISIIRWKSPRDSSPQDASYVLLKLHIEEGFLCEEAAYENGQYWPLIPPGDVPFEPSSIAAWSYFPYDFR